ncbi:acyl-CoA thioesterase [Solibacillus sp. FSL H8-0538]|uniref:acyl-CoA thioesterase n=1 Tax=Solibacillus sp. FSL H8-0538 TaxID=2921400 RepID=UPI0030FD10D4
MRAAYIVDAQQWMNGFTFSVDVQVRFSETDLNGHVNNTVIFTYFEYARIEYLKALNLMKDLADPTTENMTVVADIQCDYIKQVFFDEVLTIYVKTASVGKSSLDLHYMVKNANDEICFTGRGTLVQMNYKTGKGAPLSEKEKKLLLGK